MCVHDTCSPALKAPILLPKAAFFTAMPPPETLLPSPVSVPTPLAAVAAVTESSTTADEAAGRTPLPFPGRIWFVFVSAAVAVSYPYK